MMGKRRLSYSLYNSRPFVLSIVFCPAYARLIEHEKEVLGAAFKQHGRPLSRAYILSNLV